MIEFQAEFPVEDFPRLTHFGFESGAPTSYPPWHHHFGYEFFYFSEGEGKVKLAEGTKSLAVKAHDLIVIAPGAEHSFITEAHHLSYYWLGFQNGKRVRRARRSTLRRFEILPGELLPFASAMDHHFLELDRYFDSKKKGRSFELLSSSPRLGLIFSDLREELSRREPYAKEIICHRVLELLARVARQLGRTETGPEENDRIAAVKAYLAERHAAPPSLKALASAFKIHPAYLSRTFRSQTGKTITDFVNGERMTSAKEMLLRGASVGETARALGFASLEYFSSRFKTWCGKSPSSFRPAKKIP